MKKIVKIVIVKILEIEAKIILWKYKPKIISITGSVGKTTTKDAVFHILSKFVHVRRTKKSFNSEFGLPLTILDCDTGWNNPFIWFKNILKGLTMIVFKYEYPEWLILEVGADKPGDIERASKLIKSDIVVYTKFSKTPVHVEAFKSPDALFEEKALLLKTLKKSGVLILNKDDNKILSLKDRVKNKVVTYGFKEDALVCASNIDFASNGKKLDGVKFDLFVNKQKKKIHLKNIIGQHHVYPVLIGISIALELNSSLNDIVKYVKNHHSTKGRMKLIEGIKNSMIIDDSYNSSPVATIEALNTLCNIKAVGKRIVVLGDMLELGKYSVEAHKNIGKRAGEFCDILYVVGPRSRYVVEGALLSGMSEKVIREFKDSKTVGNFLEHRLKVGDIVLVKGSQSMRMERAVLEIMKRPDLREELLVRQEKEWLAKK